MPLPLIAEGVFGGWRAIPYIGLVLKVAPWLVLIFILKRWFGGARNKSERLLHSKVVMITVHPPYRYIYLVLTASGRHVRHWRRRSSRPSSEGRPDRFTHSPRSLRPFPR